MLNGVFNGAFMQKKLFAGGLVTAVSEVGVHHTLLALEGSVIAFTAFEVQVESVYTAGVMMVRTLIIHKLIQNYWPGRQRMQWLPFRLKTLSPT